MEQLLNLIKRTIATPSARAVAERQLARAKLDHLDMLHAEEDHRAYADACAIRAAVIAKRISRLAEYLTD